MAKRYIFDLSFFISHCKRKTRNKFQKNEKTYEKFNKILKKILTPASQKKIFSSRRGDGNNFFILALAHKPQIVSHVLESSVIQSYLVYVLYKIWPSN